MSSCCDTNQTQTPTKKDNNSDKEPTNPIEKIFWKIGKADAQKEAKRDCCQENKSCCS